VTHVSDWAGGWLPIHLRSDRAWHVLPGVPVLPLRRHSLRRGATVWCQVLGHDLVRVDTVEICRCCGRSRGELVLGPHERLAQILNPSAIDLRSTSRSLDTVEPEHTMNGDAAGAPS
jgi:hypothetical protein